MTMPLDEMRQDLEAELAALDALVAGLWVSDLSLALSAGGAAAVAVRSAAGRRS